MWCIEEQIKKLPEHGDTVQYDTCDTRNASQPVSVVICEDKEFPSSVSRNGESSYISERNIAGQNDKRTNTTNTQVHRHEPEIHREKQFSARQVQKQPTFNLVFDKYSSDDEERKHNQKYRKDRRKRKLHHEMFDKKRTSDDGYKNQIYSNLGFADNTMIPQENTKDAPEIILPKYLLPSWNKLQAVHIKEANAKLIYHYWNTLLKSDLKTDKLQLKPVQKNQIGQQLEHFETQYRKETLRSYIHEMEIKIVQLEKQRMKTLRGIEIIILEYISKNPGINHDQQHIIIDILPTGGAERILEKDQLEIPDHIAIIWNDIVACQVEEYNTRLQYHYFNILLKHTLEISNFGLSLKERKYCNQILQLNVMMENKLQDLEKQRKDKLKSMDEMLLSRRACSSLTMGGK